MVPVAASVTASSHGTRATGNAKTQTPMIAQTRETCDCPGVQCGLEGFRSESPTEVSCVSPMQGVACAAELAMQARRPAAQWQRFSALLCAGTEEHRPLNQAFVALGLCAPGIPIAAARRDALSPPRGVRPALRAVAGATADIPDIDRRRITKVVVSEAAPRWAEVAAVKRLTALLLRDRADLEQRFGPSGNPATRAPSITPMGPGL